MGMTAGKGPMSETGRCVLRGLAWAAAAALCVVPAVAQAGAVRWALIMDTSGSMQQSDPHRVAPLAASLAVAALPDGVKLAVVDTTGAKAGKFVVAPHELGAHRDEDIANIAQLPFDGDQTWCNSALERLDQFFPPAEGVSERRYLLFVSDGACNEDFARTKERLAALARRGVQMYFVGIGAATRSKLEEMAKAGGGAVLSADARPEDLPGIFASIAGKALGSRPEEYTLARGRQVLRSNRYVDAVTVLAIPVRAEGMPALAFDEGGRRGGPRTWSVRQHEVVTALGDQKGTKAVAVRIDHPPQKLRFRLSGVKKAAIVALWHYALVARLRARPSQAVLGQKVDLVLDLTGSDGKPVDESYLEMIHASLRVRPPNDPSFRSPEAMRRDGRSFVAHVTVDRLEDWWFEALVEGPSYLHLETGRIRVPVTLALQLSEMSAGRCALPGGSHAFRLAVSGAEKGPLPRDVVSRLAVEFQIQQPGQSEFERAGDAGWDKDRQEYAWTIGLPPEQGPSGPYRVRALARLGGKREGFLSNAVTIDVLGGEIGCERSAWTIAARAGATVEAHLKCKVSEIAYPACLVLVPNKLPGSLQVRLAAPPAVGGQGQGATSPCSGVSVGTTKGASGAMSVPVYPAPDGGAVPLDIVASGDVPLDATAAAGHGQLQLRLVVPCPEGGEGPSLERTASVDVSLVVAPLGWFEWLGAWSRRHRRLLLALLVAAVLVWILVRWLRAYAFPPGTSVSVYASREDYERGEPATSTSDLRQVSGSRKGLFGRNAMVHVPKSGFRLEGGRGWDYYFELEATGAHHVTVRGASLVRIDAPPDEAPSSEIVVEGGAVLVRDRGNGAVLDITVG